MSSKIIKKKHHKDREYVDHPPKSSDDEKEELKISAQTVLNSINILKDNK